MIVDRITSLAAGDPLGLLARGNKIFNETGLASIEVSGKDAAKFLQGQLTCDINTLSETQASIAAFCNAKGRVISTLLIVKIEQAFLLILPAELLETVLKKLRIYVLRAEVKLQDQSGSLHVFGLQCSADTIAETSLPTGDFQVSHAPVTMIKLPAAPRYLALSKQQTFTEFAELFGQQHCEPGSLDEWRYQDISTGLPWFGISQSEQHIPQMLNIDRLGGISFNKGCYTGQEIVARSHYLGKVKRALFVAECAPIVNGIADGCAVLDSDNQRNIGCVLSTGTYSGITRLLLVLQIVDGLPKHLILDDDYHSLVAIISDQ